MLGGHRLAVVSASFSADGRFVVTASADDTARVWDDNGGIPLAVLAGHVDSLTGATFTPKGLVVTASADGSVRVWNPGTADQLHPLGPPSSALNRVAISPDGKLALAAGTGTVGGMAYRRRTGSHAGAGRKRDRDLIQR